MKTLDTWECINKWYIKHPAFSLPRSIISADGIDPISALKCTDLFVCITVWFSLGSDNLWMGFSIAVLAFCRGLLNLAENRKVDFYNEFQKKKLFHIYLGRITTDNQSPVLQYCVSASNMKYVWPYWFVFPHPALFSKAQAPNDG